MTTAPAPETVTEVEDILRGAGVELRPHVDSPDVSDLQTADGRFNVSKVTNPLRTEHLLTVYNVLTAEALPVDTNQALRMLKKRIPRNETNERLHPQLIGHYAFTLGKQNPETGKYGPPFAQKLGTIVCMLHVDSPDSEYVRGLGIQSICIRHHIPNVIELEVHMKNRHSMAWLLIERDKATRKETETRDRLERLIQVAIGAKAVPEGTTVAQVEAEATTTDSLVTTTVETTEPMATVLQWECPKCHEVLTAETERKLIGQRGGHTRSKHPKRRRGQA